MKNLLYILLLIVPANLSAQSGIVNDELYLKYEAEYLKYTNSISAEELKTLDQLDGYFYSKFKDAKALKSFNKHKDPIKWLEKNFTKTNFSNQNEALKAYSTLSASKQSLDVRGQLTSELLKELVKKYDPALIWKTLSARLLE